MSLFDRFLGREKRSGSQTIQSSDPYLAEFFGLRGTGATAVNVDQALSNLAVAARCVALRSETLSSVGLHLYRRTASGGRERANDHPLYSVLHDQWNGYMSAFEGRELLARSLDLTGNAFARIETNSRGQVTALYPLSPAEVIVEKLASGRLRYRVSDPRGGVIVLVQDEVLHVRGPSKDGLVGMSPIQISRGAMGLAISQNEMATAMVTNGLRPSGVISFAEKLAASAAESTRTKIQNNFAGATNAGRVLVMDGGAKFEHLSWTPEDAEFLESRKLANLDIARIFGCPPTTVGIPDHGTYSNQEQEATAFVRNAIGPLAARVENALARCLLTPMSRQSLYIEHDLASLLRGDVKARFEAYRLGREIGALSPNDVRRKENEPPIDGGDVYHQPANWTPLGTVSQGAT